MRVPPVSEMLSPFSSLSFYLSDLDAQELDEAARRRLVKRLYIPLPEKEARKRIIHNLLMKAVFCVPGMIFLVPDL
jgi:hypothetical protein